MRFEKFECSQYNEFCSIMECNTKPVSRHSVVLNLRCDLKKTIEQAKIRITLHVKLLNSYKQFLIDKLDDVCEFMSGKSSSKILNFFLPPVQKYSNLNHTCPYDGSLNVVDFPTEHLVKLQAFIPHGKYRIDLHVIEPKRNSTIFFAQAYLNVVRT